MRYFCPFSVIAKIDSDAQKKTSTVSQEGRVAFSGGGSVESKIEKKYTGKGIS